MVFLRWNRVKVGPVVNKELRILILEDVATDVVMINRELRKNGLAFRSIRVERREDFVRELQEEPPDLIFSDHGLPDFNGFAALALAQKMCPEIPFIFVTGSETEEMAVETFKKGATDFVLKGRMSNLAPAVQRALQLVEERKRRKEAEQALEKSEERYRHLVELCPDALFVQSDNHIVFANSAAARLLGADNIERLIGKSMKEVVHPDYWEMMQRRLRQLREDGTTFFWKSVQGRMQRLDGDVAIVPFIEEKFVRLDGQVVDVEVAAAPLTFKDRPALQIVARDITQRKRAGG
ncbi:MAG: hypothetical protein DME19_05585 [Verrucomicrobia bacterium]|nr:MAG: hypothetical protein DME19_05585 [Verrucomicrobiota bacterium]